MATNVENGAEATETGSSVEDRQSAISNVQSQIDLLGDLSKRLQTLRLLPHNVLRSELVSGANQVVLPTPMLKDIFGKSTEDLRTLHAAAVEAKVQDALRAAAESERRVGTEIRDARRERERESQIRRRCVHQKICFFFLSFQPPAPPALPSFLFFSFLFFFFFLLLSVRSSALHGFVMLMSSNSFFFFLSVMQPLSHPRIAKAVFALAAEGRESISSASGGCAAAHAGRAADIRSGVQLDACEEGAAAHLLDAWARVAEYRRACDTPVPYP
jgi:hypothetical protein